MKFGNMPTKEVMSVPKKLFDYQQKIVDTQTKKSSALFMDMGTG